MPAKSPYISVIGSYVVGLTIRAPRFPVAGETLIGSDFDFGPGGKGSNQAVGITRLGGRCHLLLKIGSDDFGQTALDLYQSEDIDPTNIIQDEDSHTGVAVITLNAQGQNHIIVDIGANAKLTPGDVSLREEEISQSKVVMSVLEIPPETAGRAMEIGRKNEVITILNPAPACQLPEEILNNIDIITPNETELKILLGLSPDSSGEVSEMARALQSKGVKNVVVTQGSKGALVLDHRGSISHVSGIHVDVVDTTGAGDAFNSALAVALSEGEDLINAVNFAVISGGLCCTKLGVIPALPYRHQVESLIRQ